MAFVFNMQVLISTYFCNFDQFYSYYTRRDEASGQCSVRNPLVNFLEPYEVPIKYYTLSCIFVSNSVCAETTL